MRRPIELLKLLELGLRDGPITTDLPTEPTFLTELLHTDCAEAEEVRSLSGG